MLRFYNLIKENKPHLYEFHIINLLCGLFIVSLLPHFFGDFEITYITYPFRLLSIFLALYIILKNKMINTGKVFTLIFIFFSMYLFRMIYDVFYLKINYERGYMYFATYLGTVIIPFWSLLYIDFKKIDFNKVLKWIYWALFLFCLLNVAFNDYQSTSERSTGITQLWFIIFGQVGVTTSLLSLFIFEKIKDKKVKILVSLGFFLGLTVLFLSASKGPFATLIVLTLLYIFLHRIPQLFKHWSFIVFGMIGTLVLITSKSVSLFTRIEDSVMVKDDSTNERIYILTQSLENIKNHPLWGGSFLIYTEKSSFYPHNLYLEAFMTTGIVGGCLFLMIHFLALKQIYPIVKVKNYHWVLFIFLQFFIQTFFSTSIYSSSFYWLLLGIVLIIGKQVQSK